MPTFAALRRYSVFWVPTTFVSGTLPDRSIATLGLPTDLAKDEAALEGSFVPGESQTVTCRDIAVAFDEGAAAAYWPSILLSLSVR